MANLQSAPRELNGDLAWLGDVLASTSDTAMRHGIVYPPCPEESLLLGQRRKFREGLEKACGTYDLPLEQVLRMPEDPEARAQLDWLRTLLRGRRPLRVLQLHAGRGWAARLLAEDGHQVVAGDLSDDPHIGLGCAVRLRDQSGQRFACVRTGSTALPFRPEVFDCVVSFEALGRIPDLERAFQEVSRVLRPGGLFLALQESFRGVLTTQTQRLLDTHLYRLARWWLPGKLPGTANPEIVHLRSQLGATLHDARRRVPYCTALAEAAGLRTTILPAAVALTLSSAFEPTTTDEEPWPVWLNALARAYGLDVDRLRALAQPPHEDARSDGMLAILSHWMLVGNIDGVLLARKDGPGIQPFATPLSLDSEQSRLVDAQLLACAPDGFLPIYGVYPQQIEEQERYYWIQPRAGLIVPATDALEITIGCPPKPLCCGPVRVEFRLETERLPLAVAQVGVGQRVTCKLSIPATSLRHPSLFVSLTTNFGFLPSDFNPVPGCDTRLLALQLRAIRTRRSP